MNEVYEAFHVGSIQLDEAVKRAGGNPQSDQDLELFFNSYEAWKEESGENDRIKTYRG